VLQLFTIRFKAKFRGETVAAPRTLLGRETKKKKKRFEKAVHILGGWMGCKDEQCTIRKTKNCCGSFKRWQACEFVHAFHRHPQSIALLCSSTSTCPSQTLLVVELLLRCQNIGSSGIYGMLPHNFSLQVDAVPVRSSRSEKEESVRHIACTTEDKTKRRADGIT
jgi:hypothetical protein